MFDFYLFKCCLGITSTQFRSMVIFFLHISISFDRKCIKPSKFIFIKFSIFVMKIFFHHFLFSDTGNTKFVLDRINQAEKYLGSTCVQIGKVCRKEARLRDCNDQLVQNMFEFADREKINTSLRQSLQQYASYLSAVEDYRNTLVSTYFNNLSKISLSLDRLHESKHKSLNHLQSTAK